MKKRVLSILLVLCMMAALLPALTTTAQASTGGHTREEAAAWAQSKIGTADDYDGYYGAQCVDLICFYYVYLGQSVVYGNAKDYAWNALPAGWTRYSNGQTTPQTGDIVIFNPGTYVEAGIPADATYGHIGIVVGADGQNYQYVDYNSWPTYRGALHTYTLNGFSYIIRPDWPASSPSRPSYPADPVDLGEEFFAYINYGGLNLANTGGDVKTASINQSDRKQIWHFVRQTNGSYEIASRYDSLRLDLYDNSRTDGTNVRVYKDNDTNAQRWIIVNDAGGSSGSYNILPYGETGYSLDIEAASTSSGANVQLYHRNGSAAQAFKINKISDISSTLGYPTEKLNLGKEFNAYIKYGSLNLANTDSDVKTAAASKSDPKQIWHFVRQEDDSYEIASRYDSQRLDLYDNKRVSGTNVRVYKDNDTDAQRWVIVKDAGGGSGYNIMPSGDNNHTLDIYGASTSAGANVQLYDRSGSAAQAFKIELIEDISTTLGYPTKPQNLGSGFYACITYTNGDLNLENTGSNVQTAKKNESDPKQIWYFVRQDDDSYEISSAYDGQRLDLWDNQRLSGTNVRVYKDNDTKAQRWVIVNDANGRSGSYNLLPSGDNNYTLDVYDASKSAGANVQLWNRSGSAAQSLVIKQVSYNANGTSFAITASASPSEGGTVSGGGSYAKDASVTVTATANSGYIFKGWTENGSTVSVNASYTFAVTSNRTLTAVFELIDPTPSPDPTPPTTGETSAFVDVPAGAYYADAVAWAVEKGITSGTGNGAFSPESDCTRSQIVTFLWRAYGQPEPTSTVNQFTDVSRDAYYYKAVLWAAEKGITSGTGGTNFGINGDCTRAQAVTFLWRAAGQPKAKSNSSFSDVDSGAYYAEAVKWAVESNITSGTGNGRFSPDQVCTRAQIVTFLYRNLGGVS